ncbi:MAG: leucine-rich repeat protein, partial [Clostridia bacterium]|nr:leucine-rich repeat protein [Clostridia bacterium]
TYKPYVKTAEVGFIHKLRSNSNVVFGLFEGFEALTEVHFESLTLAPYWGCTDVDLFKGCKSLTTLWVGDDSNKIDGVINFTGFVETDKMPEKVLKGMFSGCEAITKVILPNLSNAGYESNGEMVYPIPTIHANTFEGCTALAEIVIPENYGVVEDGAFANLTSLRKIDLKEKDITLPAAAFTGCSKVVIFCSDVETAKTLNASLKEAAVDSDVAIAFAPSIKVLGFQVREAEYNGLRTLYSFNEKIYGETEGIELVEYGSIIASKDNYDKYSKQLGGTDAILTLDGGKFVTPAENVVKTAIWNENDGYSGKSNHEDATKVRFNTTIVRYSDELQMKAAVSMVGYEIWRMNGEYYLLITEYEDANYASPSLYNITLGMLTAEESILSLAKGDNPVWQTVNMCADTTITTDNEAVIGLLLADPANEGKFVALYATEEADEVTFGDLGTDKLTRENLTATVFGKNVVYALPELDAVWADHMDAKVEEIPEGKSFVFITDTHWNNNAKKSSSLIDYVRKATGITNVVYGGDPFDGFDSLAAAQDALTTYAQTNFYDVFGEDGIYVVGNHDVNHTASGGKAELTISDTFLYNTTVKNIENKAIFDTDMLAALENITYSEVLNSDDTVAYTSAEMKEQALAWAKMHYHYDNADDKIRYIVLDTGSNGITQLNTIIGNYTSFMSIEYDWLAKTLMSTPASYDIVVLGHQIGESTANSVASRDLFQILSAFKAKTAITANLTAHSDNTLAIMGGTTIRTYDFSASEFDGTIFSMNGHWHYDRSWIWQTELGTYGTNVAYSDSMTLSDDAILSICCNRDAMWSPGEIEMTGGTETEQSFSVITLTDDGRIVLTRFGAGESKTFIYE